MALTFDTTAAPEQASDVVTPRSSWLALAVLFIVYMLNYLDRTLIYILFPAIKKEMTLSDMELAALGSTSFVIFYTLLGVPFGKLADKVVRKWMIAAGLLTWSIFSGLTGFMTEFWGIFFCRLMVGVGEATLGPAALSLLSDLFPPRMRATVGSIYSAGIPLGAGLALLVGGAIGEHYGWRWAFYLLGFPGLVVALFVLGIKEPARGVTEIVQRNTTVEKPDWRILFQFKPLWFLYSGYAMFAVAGNTLSMWMPTFISKNFDMDIKQVGLLTGSSVATGGLLGTLLGGYAADKFRKRHTGGRMEFTALASVVCIPLWLCMLFSGNIYLTVGPFFFLSGAALMWLGPAAADVQDVVGPQLRGLGVGVYFLIVNVVGYGIAPLLIGRVNDVLGTTNDPSMMRYGLLASPISCAIAAVLLWYGSRLMREMKKT